MRSTSPNLPPAIRPKSYVFCGVLCTACIALDWLILGRISAETAPARVAWGASLVGLGFGARVASEQALRWFGTCVAVVTAATFWTLVLQTGGAASPLFVWHVALPLCFMAIAHGDIRAVVVSAVLSTASAASILSLGAQGADQVLAWSGMVAVAGAVGTYGTHAYARVRNAEVMQDRQRLQALQLLADSERRRARSERLALIGQLAAGVAHEINNPLAFVRANVSQLEQERRPGAALPEEEVQEILSETLQGIERIRQIVADLKDFSRDEAQGDACSSPNDVVAEALRLARPRLQSLSTRIELPSSLPQVAMSHGRFVQVLVNLLVNAADAAQRPGESGGEVAVFGVATARGVELRVEDDGPGIPDHVLGRIFDPFFTTKPPGAGTGLGLALCREYLDRVGGSLAASNRPSGGARFSLTVPVAELEEPESDTRSARAAGEGAAPPEVAVAARAPGPSLQESGA